MSSAIVVYAEIGRAGTNLQDEGGAWLSQAAKNADFLVRKQRFSQKILIFGFAERRKEE
jgi:hypothetical protein